ncbi:MAG: GtrA family protein [Parabacteroides sp.]|nr:GtrA family protein [Parabacteroides sp.]
MAIEVIFRIYNKFRNLILYGIIGGFSSGLDFAVYTLLVNVIGLHYQISNACSVLIGITTSFTLNRYYNFKVKDKTKRRFILFLFVGLMGLLLSSLILYICIQKFKVDELLSKLLSIVFVVVIQFLINKNITFKK